MEPLEEVLAPPLAEAPSCLPLVPPQSLLLLGALGL